MKKILLVTSIMLSFAWNAYAIQCDDNPEDGLIDDDCIAAALLRTESDPVASAWTYADLVSLWTTCTGYLKSDGTCDTPSTGATNFNDIGDASAAGSIALAGYMQTITSTLNEAGANITMTNTTADLTADVSFMDYKLTDDGDANGFFLRGYDNVSDLKWYIGYDGEFYGYKFTLAKTSGVASLLSLYEANSTDTTYVGIMGPASIAESFSHQFPDAQPAGSFYLWATPAGSGDPNGNKISAATLVTPGTGVTTAMANAVDGASGLATYGHTVQYSQTPTIGDPDAWTMSGAGMYGGIWIANATGTGALDAVAAGMNFTVKARGAVVPTLDPNGTEEIYLNGTSCGAGVTIVGSGAAGDSAVCEYNAASTWDCISFGFACGS